MEKVNNAMSRERVDNYVDEAAKLADYQDGFGISGCDLEKGNWWAAYTRQSTREQAENDRLGEYLLTCARLAKRQGVIIPREYIVYDHFSSEDFNRPGMIRLRGELIGGRCIEGIIIPAQGRLTMDPLHQMTFEKECQHYGVQIVYGDAPGGNDWGSQTTRLIQAQANALRVKTNRESALGGNIARIMAGKVPAQRPSYGYVYKAEKIIEQHRGKTRVLSAWWEINEHDPEGELGFKSRAWAVNQIFYWLGAEGRTQYWATVKLNELGVLPPYGTRWLPKMVNDIVKRRCYTGKAEYNVNKRVPNPDKPLGDLTLGVKRTILRPKPENEKICFDVPPLTTEELWQKANENLKERGRGRGKQGKKLLALFRARMICPVCGKPMAIMRRRNDRIYYHCRSRYNRWIKDPCPFSSFVPGTWDNQIWQEIYDMLDNDSWIEQQLVVELDNSREIEKLIRLQEHKIASYENRIRKVEEGFEGGLFTIGEAKLRKQKSLDAIRVTQAEIANLNGQKSDGGFTEAGVETLRLELKKLLKRNLVETTFEERLELVARLGIKVYPSEDLKSRRIRCGMNLNAMKESGKQNGFAKVVYGRPYRSRTCDPLIKSHGVLV